MGNYSGKWRKTVKNPSSQHNSTKFHIILHQEKLNILLERQREKQNIQAIYKGLMSQSLSIAVKRHHD